jgi:hypothetical protein
MPVDQILVARFAPHLAPGETVLWTGHPPHGIRLMPGDAMILPYGVLAIGYIAFFMQRNPNPQYQTGAFLLVFSMVLLVIGIFAFVAKMLRSARLRRRTAYLVTDRHVFIMTDPKGRSVISIPRAQLGAIALTEHRGGRGTLVFLNHSSPHGGLLPGGFGKSPPLSFDSVVGAIALRHLLLAVPEDAVKAPS